MMPGSCRIDSWLHRRDFLIGAGASGMALGTALGTAHTQTAAAPDYLLRIAPLRLELAPGKVAAKSILISATTRTWTTSSIGTDCTCPPRSMVRWRKGRQW
jgi:hypothetical protein